MLHYYRSTPYIILKPERRALRSRRRVPSPLIPHDTPTFPSSLDLPLNLLPLLLLADPKRQFLQRTKRRRPQQLPQLGGRPARMEDSQLGTFGRRRGRETFSQS